MSWHLFPFTSQYLAAFAVVIAVTLHVFTKNPKSRVYQAFLGFGLCMALWLIAVFFGRNAPSEFWAIQFYRIIGGALMLVHPFMLLSLLYIPRRRRGHLWVLLPPVIFSTTIAVLAPYKVLWTDLGWSYSLWVPALVTGYILLPVYVVAIIIVALFLVRQTMPSLLRKKYLLFAAAPALYVFLLLATNYLIYLRPGFPPVGGGLALIEFIIIACAISLRVEEIIPPKFKKPIGELGDSYLQFLNSFQDKTPGKELGSSGFRFMEYIESMGLKDIVVSEHGKLSFCPDKLSDADVGEIPDDILRVVRENDWATETVEDFGGIFIRAYETMRLESMEKANEWLEHMLQRHGGFLAKHGVLATMPRDAKIPRILKDLDRRRGDLLKEEKPEQAYKKLNEALSYGFTALCISKLHPEEVRERYNVGKIPIFWLTFKRAERTISPKDSAQLNRTISEFLKTPEASIILFDCFDQIKAANGFQKSLTIFKELMSLRGADNSIMLVSVNPHMFEEGQLEAVEKELEEAKTERT